ncbi:hypothetical protein G3I51_13565 [Streptomyces sp. SID9944]|nr:hypothetical protein [Streptomyces sp. SID9944]
MLTPGQKPGAKATIVTASWLDADHIAEWDPARVLREIDAKRQLLSQYEALAAGVLVLTSGTQEILSEYRRVILPSLAAAYSDRPGYREEWRP